MLAKPIPLHVHGALVHASLYADEGRQEAVNMSTFVRIVTITKFVSVNAYIEHDEVYAP